MTAKGSDELREMVKGLAREYMEAPTGAKFEKAREATAAMKAEGLDEEEAVALWYELCVEMLEETFGVKLDLREN